MEATCGTFRFGPEKTWKQLDAGEDRIKTGKLVTGGFFYAISLATSSRNRVVKYDLKHVLGAEEPSVNACQREWS